MMSMDSRANIHPDESQHAHLSNGMNYPLYTVVLTFYM
jgi:hypothetical protein